MTDIVEKSIEYLEKNELDENEKKCYNMMVQDNNSQENMFHSFMKNLESAFNRKMVSKESKQRAESVIENWEDSSELEKKAIARLQVSFYEIFSEDNNDGFLKYIE